MLPEIIMPYGGKTKLARDLKVSTVTVWKALSGRKETETTRLIRKAAIERGGREFNPDRRKTTK